MNVTPRIINSKICMLSRGTGLNTWYHPHVPQDVFVKDDSHYLNVPRVGTHTVADVFDCTFECLSHPSCLSFNLAASKGADGKLWCELLSSDRYRDPEEFRVNATSHYFSVQVRFTKGRSDPRNYLSWEQVLRTEWLHGSVVRALHWHLRSHEVESR